MSDIRSAYTEVATPDRETVAIATSLRGMISTAETTLSVLQRCIDIIDGSGSKGCIVQAEPVVPSIPILTQLEYLRDLQRQIVGFAEGIHFHLN